MLTLGEVHTCMLQHSAAVPALETTQLLGLLAGERVSRSERPITHATSPALLTGVDCRLPASLGAAVRGIGTAVSRASITGGHVVQGSAFVRIVRSEADRRLPWSHYLARPGSVEAIGKADFEDMAKGFAFGDMAKGFGATGASPESLDLGAVSDRVLDSVQRSDVLDRAVPVKGERIRLRWVASEIDADGCRPRVRFQVRGDNLRTLRISGARISEPEIVELCEDLARHDWLLTTLLGLTMGSGIGAEPRAEVVRRLRPAIDYLLHLWMPRARLVGEACEVWERLETSPGFSRQWRSTVDRIRDQVALHTLSLLRDRGLEGVGPA